MREKDPLVTERVRGGEVDHSYYSAATELINSKKKKRVQNFNPENWGVIMDVLEAMNSMLLLP